MQVFVHDQNKEDQFNDSFHSGMVNVLGWTDGRMIVMYSSIHFYKNCSSKSIFAFTVIGSLVVIAVLTCSLKRCDQTANCVDRSDEEGCQVVNIQVKFHKILLPISIYHPLMRLSVIIVNLQGNYNRKIAPFVFDEDTWSNIPANVSVSMAVTDILKIEEVDHVYTMKFRLVLEW